MNRTLGELLEFEWDEGRQLASFTYELAGTQEIRQPPRLHIPNLGTTPLYDYLKNKYEQELRFWLATQT